MPASRQANLAKSGKLITAGLLERKRERITEWWHDAYLGSGETRRTRLEAEARSSLPLLNGPTLGDVDAGALLDAMVLHRLRLQRDQRLPEWDGSRPV